MPPPPPPPPEPRPCSPPTPLRTFRYIFFIIAAEGKFPAGMSSKDFIRLEAADAVPDESGWTDQETLLLLEGGWGVRRGWAVCLGPQGGKHWEPLPQGLRSRCRRCSQRMLGLGRPAAVVYHFPTGIEKYGESWQQVAEHVGGRSAMQCVARFLQLPTEEALAADATPGPTTQGLVRRGSRGPPGGPCGGRGF